MRKLLFIALTACLASTANSELVEIKLIDPQDEPQGYCVDLFAHLTNAMPLGGFQGHGCFLGMGRGPTEDQGFEREIFEQEGKLVLAYFDVCMTLQEPKHGSYVAAEPCEFENMQTFEMDGDGRIKPVSAPDLCLTLGPSTVPGGGRLAPVGVRPPKSNEGIPQIRRLTFDSCSEERAVLQQWEFENEVAKFTPSYPSRFLEMD